MHPESLLGPDGACGRSHIYSSGGCSLSFPRFSSNSHCRVSTRSSESSAWTQGNNLLWKRQSPNSFRPWVEGLTGNVPLWQRQGFSRSWTPPPCMESEVLTVGYQTKPLSPFGHYPKCHRPTLDLLQSLELRFPRLGIQTFLPQPGYTKPEAQRNAGSRGVLPSLQTVQHWIFK